MLGMVFGTLAIAAALVLECVRREMPLVHPADPSSPYRREMSSYFMIIPHSLQATGRVVLDLGALQFLFEEVPPFLRCSCMGLMLLARGFGILLASGMWGILYAVDDRGNNNDDPSDTLYYDPDNPIDILYYGPDDPSDPIYCGMLTGSVVVMVVAASLLYW